MRSVLEITTPATNLQLLTDAEMRVAAGLAENDSSKDTALRARGLAIAAAIMSGCNIAVGKGGEPTLLEEGLKQTFYDVRPRKELLLARRHNVEVTSIVVDGGDPLDDTDYIVEPEAGILTLESGARWCARKIVVEYTAGFPTAPADLKMSATDFFKLAIAEGTRDAAVKAQEIDIPGVQRKRTEYWVGVVPGTELENAVPEVVAGQLKRFYNSPFDYDAG